MFWSLKLFPIYTCSKSFLCFLVSTLVSSRVFLYERRFVAAVLRSFSPARCENSPQSHRNNDKAIKLFNCTFYSSAAARAHNANDAAAVKHFNSNGDPKLLPKLGYFHLSEAKNLNSVIYKLTAGCLTGQKQWLAFEEWSGFVFHFFAFGVKDFRRWGLDC